MDKFTFYIGLCVVLCISALSVWRANAAVAAASEIDSMHVREAVIEHRSDEAFREKLTAMDQKLDALLLHDQDMRERMIRIETTAEQIELRLRDRFHGPVAH